MGQAAPRNAAPWGWGQRGRKAMLPAGPAPVERCRRWVPLLAALQLKPGLGALAEGTGVCVGSGSACLLRAQPAWKCAGARAARGLEPGLLGLRFQLPDFLLRLAQEPRSRLVLYA